MKIAIIGCGHMGKALAARLSQANQIFLYDHHIVKAEHLAQEGYGKACKDVQDALKAAETIILAVKPQNLKQAAELIKDHLQKKQRIVSLLAGVSMDTLRKHFSNAHIVRMMPNLAIMHGEGVVGLSTDEKRGKENLTKAFEALGKVFWLPEEKMDALTALTGSGPAFFYTMIEAMIDAGIAMGFSAGEAQGLILQMLQGSLILLEKSGKHPGELRWQISSAKGTTIAGIKKLEEQGLRGSIINTFLAAYERSLSLVPWI